MEMPWLTTNAPVVTQLSQETTRQYTKAVSIVATVPSTPVPTTIGSPAADHHAIASMVAGCSPTPELPPNYSLDSV
jgi:hypothetical protein